MSEYEDVLDDAETYVQSWISNHENGDVSFTAGVYYNRFVGKELRIRYSHHPNDDDADNRSGKTVIPVGDLHEERLQEWMNDMKEEYGEELDTDRTEVSSDIQWGNLD